ncbi:ATP-binding protein [Spirillospora sp. NPDC049652]
MATMTMNARQILLSMTYPAVPSAVGTARKSAELVLGSRGFATLLVEDVGLVVCELVTNAVKAAAGTTVGLTVAADGSGAVTVEVRDPSSAEPRRRSPELEDLGGRGLVIVAALSERYGVRREPDGKTVFAVLRA